MTHLAGMEPAAPISLVTVTVILDGKERAVKNASCASTCMGTKCLYPPVENRNLPGCNLKPAIVVANYNINITAEHNNCSQERCIVLYVHKTTLTLQQLTMISHVYVM